MGRLSDFLEMPDVSDVTSVEYINPRIGNVTIRPMSKKEHSNYQKKALGRIRARKNADIEFDQGAYDLACVANCMVDPNFKDAEFLKALGDIMPDEALQKKLYAGEIDEIAARIKTLSGFNTDIDEDIDEAKN